MRNIKFRGWNKISRMMVDDIQVYSPKDTLSLNSCFDPDMIVLPLQFTGLLDKNDVEVYEGDIVKARNEDEVYRHKYYIHYRAKQAEWQLGNKLDRGVTSMQYIDKNTIEVIGNIYENPELLK
jgi:uncharacterized phage protein (TIGR01671 family)